MFQRLSVLLFLFISVSNCIEIEEGYDIPCLDPFPRVARNVDYEWIFSIDQWYIPLQSKLNFYRYAETLLQTRLVNITSEQLDPDSSCIYYKWANPIKLFGYGDKYAQYSITQVFENKYGFNTDWVGDTRGRHYITLKDNKTFFLFTTCWKDGQASWSVMSIDKELDEEKTKLILDHIKSLGFNEDFTTKHGYDKCANNVNNPVDKNEL